MSTPPGPPPTRVRQRRSDRRVLKQGGWLVLALAVIGTSLFAGSLVFDDGGAAGPRSTPSIAPLTSAPPSPSASGSPSPSTTPTAERATKAGMTAFVESYLAAVTDDPAIAWGKLTPAFQRTSGGFADYRSFWAPISAAAPSNLTADPAAGTVSYDVTYTYADGRTTKDSTRLTLQYADDRYTIAGEG